MHILYQQVCFVAWTSELSDAEVALPIYNKKITSNFNNQQKNHIVKHYKTVQVETAFCNRVEKDYHWRGVSFFVIELGQLSQ
jgi:hypothetical protein